MRLDVFIAALASTAAPLGSSAALAQDKAAAIPAAPLSVGANAIMVPRKDGPSPGPATLFRVTPPENDPSVVLVAVPDA